MIETVLTAISTIFVASLTSYLTYVIQKRAEDRVSKTSDVQNDLLIAQYKRDIEQALWLQLKDILDRSDEELHNVKLELEATNAKLRTAVDNGEVARRELRDIKIELEVTNAKLKVAVDNAEAAHKELVTERNLRLRLEGEVRHLSAELNVERGKRQKLDTQMSELLS